MKLVLSWVVQSRGREKKMGRDRVTINAIYDGDLAEFLRLSGLEDEVKKDAFICAGCGRTMTISDVSYIKTAKPKLKVYGSECYGKVDEE